MNAGFKKPYPFSVFKRAPQPRTEGSEVSSMNPKLLVFKKDPQAQAVG